MCQIKKLKILNFCKKLVAAQKAYALIIDADAKNRHLSFPDVIQKQILIEFCDLNLKLRNPDDIDLEDISTGESYELKSTTAYDGAVTISTTQAQNADYLIWFFVDFFKCQIEVKIIDLRDANTRQEIINYSNQQSFTIKNLYENKMLKRKLIINMSNLKIKCANV